MIKVFAIIGAFICLGASAFAEEHSTVPGWIFIGQDSGGISSFIRSEDIDKIYKSDESVKHFWLLLIKNDGSSQKRKMDIDCYNQKYSIIFVSDFDKNGNLKREIDGGYAFSGKLIVPDSYEDMLRKYVCKK